MSIGKLRNRHCPYGHKIEDGSKFGYTPKWKKCSCYETEYWKGFNTTKTEVPVKENLHGKVVEHTKIVTHRFIGSGFAPQSTDKRKLKRDLNELDLKELKNMAGKVSIGRMAKYFGVNKPSIKRALEFI